MGGRYTIGQVLCTNNVAVAVKGWSDDICWISSQSVSTKTPRQKVRTWFIHIELASIRQHTCVAKTFSDCPNCIECMDQPITYRVTAEAVGRHTVSHVKNGREGDEKRVIVQVDKDGNTSCSQAYK
eukprot:m.266144 g.266144  ORF g.266144 m.266144 type:complete len:126 (-) comp15627_c0_seq52:4912-5289(-)